MKSVRVICFSARCPPVRTTVHSSTAIQIRTTQKIAVLILEFTKPPYRRGTSCRHYYSRRRGRHHRFHLVNIGDFPDRDHYARLRPGRELRRRTEAPCPNDCVAAG